MYVGTPVKGRTSRAARNLTLPKHITLSGPYPNYNDPYPRGRAGCRSETFFVGNDYNCFQILRYNKRRYVVIYDVKINRFNSLKLAVDFCIERIKND